MRQLTPKVRAQLKTALAEDIGAGDITTWTLVSRTAEGKATVVAREHGIFCGEQIARELFRIVQPGLKLKFFLRDGQSFSKNKTIFEIQGSIQAILSAERTVLNFISHLSGVATVTHCFVRQAKKYRVAVLDTRKTTPLWRELEKYAVRTGGGKNHRMGLYDQLFVKENHRPFGVLRKLKRHPRNFVMEIHNLTELRESLHLAPKIILFDNFDPRTLRRAVKIARAADRRVVLEASGGITLKNIRQYLASGVDQISVGSLTHSVKSIDFSLQIV